MVKRSPKCSDKSPNVHVSDSSAHLFVKEPETGKLVQNLYTGLHFATFNFYWVPYIVKTSTRQRPKQIPWDLEKTFGIEN